MIHYNRNAHITVMRKYNLKSQLLNDKHKCYILIFKGAFENRELPSLTGESPENTIIVPLIFYLVVSRISFLLDKITFNDFLRSGF